MHESIKSKSTLKIDRSPCLTCHRKNKDKTRCAPICKRLDAFRLGNDYSGLPIPDEIGIEGQTEPEIDFCTRCEEHPVSGNEGLCVWCRRLMKREASKKKSAA